LCEEAFFSNFCHVRIHSLFWTCWLAEVLWQLDGGCLEQSSGRISSAQHKPWTITMTIGDVFVLSGCGTLRPFA